MTNSNKGISGIVKNVAFLTIKIAIAAVLILWLLKQNRLDFAVLSALNFSLDTFILASVGALSVLCGLLLLGWRLWLLLHFKRFSVTYKKVLGITLMGSFFSVVLPGLAGGDAMKAIYLCSNVSERRIDALSLIVVDRVIGLYSLLLLGTIAFFLGETVDAIPLDRRILLAAPTAVIVVGLGACFIAWDGFFNSHFVKTLCFRMPKAILNFIQALRSYFKAPKLLMGAVILSVLNHALVVVSFVVAAFLLKDNLPIFAHFIINPLAMLANVIPLTPGGLGMAEGAFSLIFQAAGSLNGAIVGLLGRFIQYAVFILAGSAAILLLKVRSQITTVDFKNVQPVAEEGMR